MVAETLFYYQALVTGDFNALSPLDFELHEQTGLLSLLQKNEKLVNRFLNESGSIDYRPMEFLLKDCQLTDLYVMFASKEERAGHTQYRPDGLGLRIDFILANEAFMKKYAEGSCKIQVLNEEIVRSLSDHRPIQLLALSAD